MTAVMLAIVADVIRSWVPLMLTLLFVFVAWKSVPLIVTVVPAAPIVGVKLVIVGGILPEVATMKLLALIAEPLGEVTLIGPLVAPAGTVTCKLLVVAVATVAAVPLKLTVLALGVALKPTPVMLTVAPTVSLSGVNSIMATEPALLRSILVMLPTGS